VARSQRDVDEDERKQFSDPSLVIEAQTRTRGARKTTPTNRSRTCPIYSRPKLGCRARAADSPLPGRRRPLDVREPSDPRASRRRFGRDCRGARLLQPSFGRE